MRDPWPSLPKAPPVKNIPGLEATVVLDRPAWTKPLVHLKEDDSWFYLMGLLAAYQQREPHGRNPQGYEAVCREAAFAYHVRHVWPTHVLPIAGTDSH